MPKKSTLTPEQIKERNQANFRKWYDSKKEAYNKKRRERYSKDKKYHDKAVASAQATKAKKAKEKGDRVEREWEGETIFVHRIGEVSAHIEKSVFVIRDWEQAGVIPKPIFPGPQRVYTDHQMNMLKEFSEALDEAGDSIKAMNDVKENYSPSIHEEWEKNVIPVEEEA